MKSSTLSLLLCLLLLGGCAAPAEQGQIIVSPTVSPMTTATVAPTVTPVPHSTSMGEHKKKTHWNSIRRPMQLVM